MVITALGFINFLMTGSPPDFALALNGERLVKVDTGIRGHSGDSLLNSHRFKQFFPENQVSPDIYLRKL